jgi:hypothetical protein
MISLFGKRASARLLDAGFSHDLVAASKCARKAIGRAKKKSPTQLP